MMLSCIQFYAVASLFLLSTLGAAYPKGKPTCAKGLHVIGVRGNSTGPPNPYGLLGSTIVGIKHLVPGSTNTSVAYARKGGEWIGPNGKGSLHLTTQIENYVAACPSTPIVLAGYSRGGIIVMNTICGGSSNSGPVTPPLDPKYLSNIIAILIYGEESRVSNQTYDVGTCQGYGEVARDNAAACEPYAGVIQSWCDTGDPDCCVGGTDPSIHLQYPKEYNKAAFNFVSTQYSNWLANGTAH